jgi:hypothetical protein
MSEGTESSSASSCRPMKKHVSDYSISCGPKISPDARGCRDRELVRYVGRFGAVSLAHVEKEMGTGRTATYRHVKRCIEAGLLERLDLVSGEPAVLRATKDGLGYAYLPMKVASVSPGSVRHWLTCARVAHSLEDHYSGIDEEFRILTQREIPLACAIDRSSLGRAKIRRTGQWHSADLVVLLGREVHIVEVELTPKAPARLCQILLAWHHLFREGEIGLLIYICAAGQTRRAVERAARKVGFGEALVVVDEAKI